jgi:glycolate oxidase iron-sulfur subunit
MTGPGRELDARRDLAARCRSCGTCRSVCPIFAEIGREDAVARGKVALIRAVLAGELDLSETFDSRIQLCLNCKACVDACPNEVRVDDLTLAARSGLVEAGRMPFVKRFIFRQLLRRGRLLPPVGRAASFFQRVLMRGLPQGSPLRLLMPAMGVDSRRVFPQFASRSFIDSTPEVAAARPEKTAPSGSADSLEQDVRPMPDVPGSESATTDAAADDDRARIARDARRVAYFVGCAANLIYPETGGAVVDALSRSGVEVVVPKAQRCCGTPVFNAGDFVTAREMARRNIEAFRTSDVDAVVTACGSCGLTLKREYAELLGFTEGMGLPVFDFTEFLELRGGLAVDRDAGIAPRKVRVAYHDPCHLVRGQGVCEAPRMIIRSLPWVEFVEMRDSDRCCGGGGSFSLLHYDLSKAITKRKVDAIRDADVDIVATECQSCVMQLADAIEQAGLDVAVVSVAELIAQGEGARRAATDSS